jgi:hypothetical protein
MSRDPGRRRKAEERRRKRKQRENGKRLRSAEQLRSLAGRLALAGRGALVDCRVGTIPSEPRKPYVLIAREAPAGITAALFLVDLGCLGLKECIVSEELSARDYEGLVESTTELVELEPSSAARARKLLQTAQRYASDLGFRTPPDCAAALALFGDADPATCTEPFECGADGMPFYDPGLDDDVREVLRRLEERCGVRGFQYLVLPSEVEHTEEFPGEDDPDPLARAWGRLRRAEDWLTALLTKTAYLHFGERFRERAWAAFAPEWDPDEREALEQGVGTVLDLWALTRPIPGCVPKGRPAGDDEECSLLEVLLEENEARLGELELRLLDELERRPFSFYVVRTVDPGRSMTLADVFTGAVHEVHERSGSRGAVVGAVFFARVVSLDSVAVLMGCSGYILPPSVRFPLLRVRDILVEELGGLDEEKLRGLEHLSLEQFCQIVHDLRFPPEPMLENTDGEELLFHSLRYELVCAPREALAALKDLAFEWTDEDLEEEAELDASGELAALEFPWQGRGDRAHPSGTNTVLGHLRIEARSLRVEVNSAARSQRIQREIERRLGARAVLCTVEEKTVEELRAEKARAQATAGTPESAPAALEPAESPALAENTRALAAAHWKAWFDQPIPALQNASPREAARTPEGRELLDVLLADYAFHGTRGPMAADVAALRGELGLSSD